MFGKKKKVEKNVVSENAQMVSLPLPAELGFPLPRVFISKKDLRYARICLRSLSRNGRIGPAESQELRRIFGKAIARGEAKELGQWIDDQYGEFQE